MKKKDKQSLLLRNKYFLWFKEIDKDDIPFVGGKGANLGEMASFNIPGPNGFVITAKAYFDFIAENNFKKKIQEILKNVDLTDPQTLNVASHKVKGLILQGKISSELAKEIINNYLKLGGIIRQALVAIRSSATAEDLPTASFAGQQASFLNVKGEANVVEKVRECWASLFEPRAIFYRQEKGFDHFKVGIAVIVQEMIPSEISGVMFTIDPVSNQKNKILIEAIYGLGEYIVQGIVTPDLYLINKDPLEIISRQIEKQTIQLISASGGSAFGGKAGSLNKKTGIPRRLQTKRKLTDSQIIELAKIGKKIHQHYFYPQDIEWALNKNKFYILQTRPVTTLRLRQPVDSQGKPAKNEEKREPILTGQRASPGLSSGPVKIIKSAKEINKVKQGDVLVTTMTTPDFVPAMKQAVAIVTDKGGQTSHAAIVSRELGIPCVVGTKKATAILKNNQVITVNGSDGKIYKGGLANKPSILINRPLKNLASQALPLKTATKIYVNLAEPKLAKEIAQRNVDGVGLLRAEFTIAQIGVHPKQLIKNRKQKQLVDQLAADMFTFCEAFQPRPVVYRATDFKTNEYRNLTGGKAFEPVEENPFIGFRGAFRYLANPEVFELELEAIKRVREKFNLKNLWLMIPFCRTPHELREVKKIIAAKGLLRSPTFKLWLMVEIPANVILLEDFIEVGIDGVSIGSNDLTMLILGVDRDNAQLAQTFNEQDPAVLWALEKTIKTCQKYKITSSICGQAPSVYPSLVEKLVDWGITSISISHDTIEKTRELVYQIECQKLKKLKPGKS